MPTINAEGPSVRCSRCGYDLRGTAIGASCPECGLSVNASVIGMRVKGKDLIVQDDVNLPRRCVITNKPVETKPIKRTLYYYHQAVLLLILVNLLVFLIVALIVRKRCTVTYYLCEEEAAKRRNKLLLASLLLFGSIAMTIGSIIYEIYELVAGGIVLLIVSLVCLIIFGRTLRIVRVKQQNIYIRGAGKEFLDSLGFTT